MKPAERRRLHLIAGACGLGAGVGVARYLATRPRPPAGKPLAVGIGQLAPGQLRAVEWQGRTVWLLRRGSDDIAALAASEGQLRDPLSAHSLQPEACRNRHRSLRPDLLVVIGQCTHQGCTPQLRTTEQGSEFLCPCHASKFDLAGRVFAAGPAPANLVIPEYRFDGDERVVIGES